MYHKFKDYNRNEQREIVFEIIRQKYIYNPNLNNFKNNTEYLIKLVKAFQIDQISVSDLKLKLEDFNNKLDKEVADEILFYFYNIADANAEKGNSKFSSICKIIKDIIDVDTLSDLVQIPEDKMGKPESSGNGFVLQSYSKYPAPESYSPPKKTAKYNFVNPYTTKDFESICDYVRYKTFELFIENKFDLNILEDLDNISVEDFVPDYNDFINFPQVEDEDGEKEDLDFENPGDYVINNENSITFGGGGDWQEPKTFSMKMQNGKIKVFDIEDGYNDGGYGVKEIIKIICKLFGLDRKNYDLNDDIIILYNDMVANKDFKLEIVNDITTEDCIKAIVNEFPNQSSQFLNPKNWKRKIKKGSYLFTRIFQNKVTKDIVEVVSTKTEIKSIKML